MATNPDRQAETLSPGHQGEVNGANRDSWARTLDSEMATILLSVTLCVFSGVVLLSVLRRQRGRKHFCGFPFSLSRAKKAPEPLACENTGVLCAAGSDLFSSTSAPSLASPSPECLREKASSTLQASGISGVEFADERSKQTVGAAAVVRRSASFISGARNRSALSLAASFFSSGVGTWIFYCPPQLSSLYGVWPVVLYAVAIALPLWILMYAGPIVREEMQRHVAFGLTDYVHRRFGRSMQIVTAVVSFFSTVMAMAGELAFLAAAAQTLAPSFPRLAVILSVAMVTFTYTAFLGTNASLETDNLQGILLPLLLLIVPICAFMHSQVSQDAWKAAATWTAEGASSGVLMVLSCCPAYAMDQGMWQRVMTGSGSREVRFGLFGGSLLVLMTVSLLGVTGIVARATAVTLETQGFTVDEDSLVAAPFFFLILPSLSRGLVAVVFVLAVILTVGSVDTFQSALPSLVAGELNTKGVSFDWALLVSFIANFPAVLLAYHWTESFIQLLLIGNLLTAAIFPPIFLGLWKRTTALGSVVGSIAGVASIFFSGLLFTGGDLSMAARWIVLPLGMGDPTAVYTFLTVPVTAALITICVSVVLPRNTASPCERIESSLGPRAATAV
ncbi:transporter, solute:sodium symporter (SSS) family protein [Toxoplasma gondii ARI]|uniref:Transporter, solute:sodium symporter (SSS) family protein n=1 Tax=Toxoplasma gondii ARI TaxID=1074872 RepID=A0A139Y7W9_TOXGO|nr:transporter, solute:sodium symporter (SSS) family protein [Toxoplasma gondii ARI]